MKLVTTMIKSAKLDALHRELERVGVTGMTVTEVMSLGERRTASAIWRSADSAVELLPRYKVEVVVHDPLAEPVVEAIERTAGPVGGDAGALFELEVGKVVRIRTGETDLNAI